MWNPLAFLPEGWKINSATARLPFHAASAKAKAKGKGSKRRSGGGPSPAIVNVFEVVNDLKAMGRGLVTSVEVA